MAVTAVLGLPAGAINYTYTTDTSADWSSVANSTYFYDKADKLVHFKNSSGVVLEIFSNGSTPGVFGIANTSGVYTYYATPALAYAAATVGQTIEMFADYTTSGAEELSLTKNVNWNGNGHSWSKTTADASNIITTAYASCNFSFRNINLNRSNGITSAYCFLTSNTANGKIYMNGSILNNSSTSMYALNMQLSSLEIINGTFIGNNGTGCIIGAGCTITNCKSYGITGIALNGIANFCFGQGTTGNGIGVAGTANNCIGVSTSGHGMLNNGSIYNCIGRSISGYGIDSNAFNDFVNSVGVSVSFYGLKLYNSTSKNVIGNTGISSSSNALAIQSTYCFNHTLISTSNVPVQGQSTTYRLYNTNIISNWNNALGYGISSNLPEYLINCTFQLANSTAPYIYNSNVAKVVNMKGNTYEGGAEFNANITQGIISTLDNQGNIYL